MEHKELAIEPKQYFGIVKICPHCKNEIEIDNHEYSKYDGEEYCDNYCVIESLKASGVLEEIS